MKDFFANLSSSTEDTESKVDAAQAINNWVSLSSGTGDNDITKVPGALLNLLADFGELAGYLAKLIGLVA
ncbi:hypothetical protein [Corynebacterium mucifaciens]|uniref:Uncharacterized protein n=1 Tax=Corynebacterium mucifaciens TaxID=57171 RepID=A0A7X6LRR3_9CORY|nr:hypothetical protein [Corynebacterium mucifaciens]NKY69154.1 hypothetical protein [Corynebacterium mucifaciens]